MMKKQPIHIAMMLIIMGLSQSGCFEGDLKVTPWVDEEMTKITIEPNVDLGQSDLISMDMMMVDMAPDLSTQMDMMADMVINDPCANVTCSANATCSQGVCQCNQGYEGDGITCVLPDECANVSCNQGAICKLGKCICETGFMGDGQTCTAIAYGNTASRSEQNVCQRWKQDGVKNSSNLWQDEPNDPCALGKLDPVAHEDAIRMTTLYRWLVGLGPVATKADSLPIVQSCATTLAATKSGLHHEIDQTFTCYTQQAAQGASSSNLALGVTYPADSVSLYVRDNGVTSLGHRRWIFNPAMGATAFGQRDRYSCMYSFDSSNHDPTPDYVAYPAPGFFPKAALLGKWSFASLKYGFDANTTVTIKRVSDNMAVSATGVYIPEGTYGWPTLAWTVSSNDIQTGVPYEVTLDQLTGSVGTTVTYRITLSDCP